MGSVDWAGVNIEGNRFVDTAADGVSYPEALGKGFKKKFNRSIPSGSQIEPYCSFQLPAGLHRDPATYWPYCATRLFRSGYIPTVLSVDGLAASSCVTSGTAPVSAGFVCCFGSMM